MSAFAVFVGLVGVLAVQASTLESVRDGLAERYHLSRIEIRNPGTQGDIARPGVVLTLQVDGVPANRLRVILANTRSPRFHVKDYAQKEVASDARLAAAPGQFTLNKGTRLAVLDLRVGKDRVRLFTHTLARVPLAGSQVAYGCTEFVFRADPELLARGEIRAIQDQIERVLSREASA